MYKLVTITRELADDLIGLFFPNLCLGCGQTLIRGEETICNICHFHFPKTYFHNDPENIVRRAFWGRVDLEAAAAYLYFQKGSTVQHLLHQLKYKGRQEIGIRIGKWYGLELREAEAFRDVEMIIPVPLHPGKLRRRGYNQSQLFAEGLAATMKIECMPGCLYRKVDSKTQTRKSRYDRWENVEDIFAVRHPEKITGRQIMLVDDVITTGATLESCARALLDVPGVKICLATIAYASD
jgi:ComF family protein